MKSYLLLPLALFAGLVIGGLGPRAELRELRTEAEQMRRIVQSGDRVGAGGSRVGSLLGLEEGQRRRSHSMERQPGDGAVREPDQATAQEEVAETSQVQRVDQVADVTEPDTSVPGDWDLDAAIELWQTRVEIAKSTFVSNARLNDVQSLQFETALAAMNIRIGATIDAFAASIRDADVVQPEVGIRMVHAITEAMVITYDEMNEELPDGWRQRAGERFSLTDFIDPEVARPLIGIEDRLRF